jgi:hypothetical protein
MDKALRSSSLRRVSMTSDPTSRSPPGHHLDRDALALPASLLATTRIARQSPATEDRTSLSSTYVSR